MKKWIRRILLVPPALMLIGAVALSIGALLPQAQPPDSLLCEVRAVGEDTIVLRLMTTSSAMHYNKMRQRVEEDRLYLEAYYGLIGFRADEQQVVLTGDFAGVREIYLEDSREERLVWSAAEEKWLILSIDD